MIVRVSRVRRFVSVIGALALTVGVLAFAPSAAADTAPANPADPATPPSVSADPLPTVQIDGVVWDQEVVGNTVFAVGRFNNARPAGAAPGTQSKVWCDSPSRRSPRTTGDRLPAMV